MKADSAEQLNYACIHCDRRVPDGSGVCEFCKPSNRRSAKLDFPIQAHGADILHEQVAKQIDKQCRYCETVVPAGTNICRPCYYASAENHPYCKSCDAHFMRKTVVRSTKEPEYCLQCCITDKHLKHTSL